MIHTLQLPSGDQMQWDSNTRTATIKHDHWEPSWAAGTYDLSRYEFDRLKGLVTAHKYQRKTKRLPAKA